MSAKLLSQKEIDALMTQYSEESGEEQQETVLQPKKEVINYDFRHPKLVSQEQMRSLRNLHETLARNLSVAFTNTLRTIVDVQLNAIDQVVYSEFVQSIASPSALFLFTIEEWGGEAVIEIDPRFCIFSVERQSGGSGKEMTFRREMTQIEEKIMSRVMNRVYSEIQLAWEPFTNLTIYQHSYESNPENIQIISAVEPAIVVFYSVQVYDSKATFNMCYPYALLEEALSNSLLKMSNQMRKDDLPPEQRAQYEEEVKQISVPLQAELGTTKITIRDLIQMQQGDVIPLDRRVEEPMDVKVNDRKKLQAYPGTVRKQKAIKVYDFYSEENDDNGRQKSKADTASEENENMEANANEE